MKSLLLALFIVCSLQSKILKNDFYERPDESSCSEIAPKICTYYVKNMSASALIRELNQTVLAGRILTRDLGYVIADGHNKIQYLIKDNTLKNDFEAHLIYMDKGPDAVKDDLIKVTTEIYALTESAMSEFGISIMSALSRSGTTATDVEDPDVKDGGNYSFSMNDAAIGVGSLAMNIGSSIVNSAITGNRVRHYKKKLYSVVRYVNNRSSISFTDETVSQTFVPGAVSPVEIKSGLSIYGKAEIATDDPDIININNLNIDYSQRSQRDIVAGELDDVNKVKFSFDRKTFFNGTTNILSMIKSEENGLTRGYGVLKFDRAKDQTLSRMMISMKATPVKFEDMVSMWRERAKVRAWRTFSDQEIAKLPATGPSLQEIVDDLKIQVIEYDGQLRFRFQMNKELASQETVKKHLSWKIKGTKGYRDEGELLMGHLMLSGTHFKKELGVRQSSEPRLKFTITFKDESDKSSRKKYKKTFLFLTESNSIIHE